jgi:anti-anti-sigma regulatory factor
MQSNGEGNQNFSYFISHKGAILVASLSGHCEDQAAELLQRCKLEIEELITEKVHGVILNFSGVTSIANDLVPFWAQLQSMIRSRHVELRLCGIENSLKERLHKMGVIRLTETTDSLKEALPEIVMAMKKTSLVRTSPSAPKKAA